MTGVFCGVLSRGTVPTRWAFRFRELELPQGSRVELVEDLPFDHARNAVVQMALDEEYEWLFFLDDDVLPPPDAVDRLISHKLPIVSGLYYRRQRPIHPVMYYDGRPFPTPVKDFVQGTLFEVDLVGAGCLLIHKTVLTKVHKPLFQWTMDRDDLPIRDCTGEDIYFCRKAKEAGFKIHIDTSVACSHMGYGEVTPNGVFRPVGKRRGDERYIRHDTEVNEAQLQE